MNFANAVAPLFGAYWCPCEWCGAPGMRQNRTGRTRYIGRAKSIYTQATTFGMRSANGWRFYSQVNEFNSQARTIRFLRVDTIWRLKLLYRAPEGRCW